MASRVRRKSESSVGRDVFLRSEIGPKMHLVYKLMAASCELHVIFDCANVEE